jgi:hypothetical protein
LSASKSILRVTCLLPPAPSMAAAPNVRFKALKVMLEVGASTATLMATAPWKVAAAASGVIDRM